jgi:hypothetical protein
MVSIPLQLFSAHFWLAVISYTWLTLLKQEIPYFFRQIYKRAAKEGR